ncbi:uncharacterized protein LOC111336650 [Stylophora pistillata]|uniref:uncharacterized protein LOC111336650 n=1 Tax=Stylophora pistillata TaxID=50429 RepID=UPI000C04A4E7|nr:uncharacterized protein LOC111336650 [Stylophora pistillata]
MSISDQALSEGSDSCLLNGLGLDAIFQEEESARCLSLDMWGNCRADNFQQKLEENESFKPLRVHLLRQVADYFNRINVRYFIYGGTALAVYREGGKIIKHDGDIDLAILETDFSNVVHNIDKFPALKDGDIFMSEECSLLKRGWFDAEGNEIPFCGVGGKRLKLFATRKLFRQFGFETDEHFDIGLAHVDVFTLSEHPDDPKCFCVNWNVPGAYDYRKKAFPKSIFFPLKTYSFEGLEVTGMNDLKAYLDIEYGYLGRGAMYDLKTQLYVKIPEILLTQLPEGVQQSFLANS